MALHLQALHVPAGGGRPVRLEANRILFKVDAAAGARRIGLFVSSFPSGGGYPHLHVHHSYEEVFHVLDGEIEYRLGDDGVHAMAGSTIFVPPGVPHCFQNIGPTEARIIVVGSPPEVLRMIEELAEAGPDLDQHAKIFARYDSHLVELP